MSLKMNLKTTLPALALGLAVAAGGTVTTVDTAHAYACKASPHQAVGVRNLRIGAKNAARVGWTNTAKSQFGLPWSVWKISSSRSITCSKLSSGKWRCLASAKPCKYVVN